MSNQTLSQIKQICQAYNIQPARSKGQNFLINKKVIEKIAKSALLTSNDVVLEIGPGLGILTEQLIKTAKKVISVELDRKLFEFLKVKFVNVDNLNLVNQDILKFDPKSYQLKANSYKVVANLPYNITSFFLKKFLTADNRPSAMTLLIQKEVAARICAIPGKMSLLAVSIQLYGQPKVVGLVSRDNFWPSPEVDSAILTISKIKKQKEVDKFLGGITQQQFFQIVRIGFSAKRKQLQNNLTNSLRISSTEVKKVLKKANFDPKIRAQNLSVKDWLTLAKKLKIYLN